MEGKSERGYAIDYRQSQSEEKRNISKKEVMLKAYSSLKTFITLRQYAPLITGSLLFFFSFVCLLLIDFIFILLFLCMCVFAHTHAGRHPQTTEESITFLGAVVTGGCELLA